LTDILTEISTEIGQNKITQHSLGFFSFSANSILTEFSVKIRILTEKPGRYFGHKKILTNLGGQIFGQKFLTDWSKSNFDQYFLTDDFWSKIRSK